MKHKTTLLFDMFFTLADPHRELESTESGAWGISNETWREIFWDEEFTHDRGIGLVKTDRELAERAALMMPKPVTEAQIEAFRLARNRRMEFCLREIRPEILRTLARLKEAGYRLCLVSNADVTDCRGWNESPLKEYFEAAIFSCQVGVMKPDPAIYRLALERMGITAAEAVFIGDGGDHELQGAGGVGLDTIWTEYLMRRGESFRKETGRIATYHVEQFTELITLLGKPLQ